MSTTPSHRGLSSLPPELLVIILKMVHSKDMKTTWAFPQRREFRRLRFVNQGFNKAVQSIIKRKEARWKSPLAQKEAYINHMLIYNIFAKLDNMQFSGNHRGPGKSEYYKACKLFDDGDSGYIDTPHWWLATKYCKKRYDRSGRLIVPWVPLTHIQVAKMVQPVEAKWERFKKDIEEQMEEKKELWLERRGRRKRRKDGTATEEDKSFEKEDDEVYGHEEDEGSDDYEDDDNYGGMEFNYEIEYGTDSYSSFW